jgi:hypothetical protein
VLEPTSRGVEFDHIYTDQTCLYDIVAGLKRIVRGRPDCA